MHVKPLELRQRARLRQIDLAMRAGVAITTIQGAEKLGAFSSHETRQKVAAALGVNPATLAIRTRRAS